MLPDSDVEIPATTLRARFQVDKTVIVFDYAVARDAEPDVLDFVTQPGQSFGIDPLRQPVSILAVRSSPGLTIPGQINQG